MLGIAYLSHDLVTVQHRPFLFFFFFFNDTATTEIYTLSLHDALPIWTRNPRRACWFRVWSSALAPRSEEHTSELQSRRDLVCRLLLEKKKKKSIQNFCEKKKKKHKKKQYQNLRH